MIRQGIVCLMGEEIRSNIPAHPEEAILLHGSHHTRKEVVRHPKFIQGYWRVIP